MYERVFILELTGPTLEFLREQRESLPVEKFVTPSNLNTSSPLELDNLCFMGTNVVSGSATGVVPG